MRDRGLAHAISVLSKYRLFLRHDILLALVEFDDGLWRFGVEPRREGGDTEMDPGYHVLRRGVRGAASD